MIKIPFSRIANAPVPFEYQTKKLFFKGTLQRARDGLIKANFTMQGAVQRLCDRCGEEVEQIIDENIKLLISDGVFKDSEHKLSDAVEFFGGNIELDELCKGELESFLSDYFYCQNCENL